MRSDTPIELEIKQFIIDTLSLEDMSPSQIDTDGPLFGDGVGLDSVDALEIGIALKKKYGIIVDPKSEDTRKHFRSIKDLADFVSSQSQGDKAHG